MYPIDKKVLIQKFLDGSLEAAEERQLEGCIERGEIDLSELTPLHELHEQLDYLAHTTAPAGELSLEEKSIPTKTEKTKSLIERLSEWFQRPGSGRLAYASLALLIGLTIGWLLNSSPASEQQLQKMNEEIIAMKEIMMLNLLEQPSSSERLKAVGLSKDIGQGNSQVVEALIQTLRQDDNVNVRLAALEALYDFAEQPEVRIGLVQSIKHQQSPLVLIAISEVMVVLQEKGGIQPLQDIIQQQEIPTELKKRLEQSIETLL